MAEVMLTINAQDRTSAAFRSLENAAKSAFDQIKSAVAAIAGISALEELIRRSTLAAAAAESVGVSLKILGQNVGYSSDQLDAYVEKMTKLNYTHEEARAALTGMIERNIDLSNSTRLASIAQDASTVSHETSTEALNQMNFAISTGMTRTLKHMGIIVDFTTAEKKYAEAHGTTIAFLTEKEKTQIRVNEVERAAVSIHGAYAASMDTAEGIMKRLSVATDETKDAFGKLFLPVYKEILSQMLDVMKDVQKWFEENPGKVEKWGTELITTFYNIEAEGTRFSMLLDKIGGTMTKLPFIRLAFGSTDEERMKANLEYQQRYEEGGKRLLDLAIKLNSIEATGFNPDQLKDMDEAMNKFQTHLDNIKKSLSGASWKIKVDIIESDTQYSIAKLKEYDSAKLITDHVYYQQRNDLIKRAENEAAAIVGKEKTKKVDDTEKNRVIMEQNKGLLASYWSVNDAIVKLTGSNVEQANAQDMVFFSSKEYLDLVQNHSPLAQAILNEQKHLHSLQGIDAVYKDLTAHLAALKEIEGMGQEIQVMKTATMIDPFEKRRQAQKDNYNKQLDDTRNYVTQKQALLKTYDELGIRDTDQRYQDEVALIKTATDKEFAIEQQYAYDKQELDQKIAIEKMQIVSTTLGQVAQLMMTGNEREFEEGKRLAEAEAGINAALAIVKAYGELGPIYGTVAAIGIVAATAVQIGKIEGQHYTARAAGGPVEAGGSYLVGEEGPELIRMGSAGTVIPNNALAQAGKEQLDATHEQTAAVKENTSAVTKVADGFTKITGMLNNFVGNFQVFTNSLATPQLEKGMFEKLASRDEASLTKIAGGVFEKFSNSWAAGPLNWGKSLTEHTGGLIFGGQQSLAGQGISLGYGPGGVQGSQYTETHTKGGLFSSGHNDTSFSALPSDFQKMLQDNSQLLKDAIINAAAAIGQGAEGHESRGPGKGNRSMVHKTCQHILRRCCRA
jgi:SLT domain-containing protein